MKKLKLTALQIPSFVHLLNNFEHHVNPNYNLLEYKMVQASLKEVLLKLMAKMLNQKAKCNLNLTDVQHLAISSYLQYSKFDELDPFTIGLVAKLQNDLK